MQDRPTISQTESWQLRHSGAELGTYRVIADLRNIILMSKNKKVNEYLSQTLSDLETIVTQQCATKEIIQKALRDLKF